MNQVSMIPVTTERPGRRGRASSLLFRSCPNRLFLLVFPVLFAAAAPQPVEAQSVRSPPALVQNSALTPKRTSALTLSSVGGSVEVQGGVWTEAQPAQPLTTALRVGTGRAVVSGPEGSELTVGRHKIPTAKPALKPLNTSTWRILPVSGWAA